MNSRRNADCGGSDGTATDPVIWDSETNGKIKRCSNVGIWAFLASLVLLTSIAAAANDISSPAPADDYRINLKLDPSAGRGSGEMALEYQNQSPQALTEIRLRLDLNLSPRQSISIDSVTDAKGHEIPWNYVPFKFAKLSSDRAQLRVTLSQPLPQGAAATLYIKFSEVSPPGITNSMVTLQDDPYVSFDAWYPKAMTPRGAAWAIDDDRRASYSVALDLPADFVVAGSGAIVQDSATADGRRTVILQESGLRGFSVYASPDWKVRRAKTRNVDLAVFYPALAAKYAQPMLDSAADTIGFYERQYGPFPSKHLNVVTLGDLGDQAHGSSASYNVIVVWLGGDFEHQYKELIAHELAHQYFGSAIGLPRDEIGWAANGLGLTMDRHYCESIGLDYSAFSKTILWFYEEAERRGYNTSLSQSAESLMSSTDPLWANGWVMSLQHGKAMLACNKLEQALGEDAMRSVIQQIIRDKSGALLSDADLITYCEKKLGKPLDPSLHDLIFGSPPARK